MTDEYDEIGEHIKKIIEQAEKAMGDKYELGKDMDFELSVAKTKGVKGGGKFVVVEAGGKYEKEEISKVKISIKPKEKKKKLTAKDYHFAVVNK